MFNIKQGFKSMEIQATIRRADGTIEELGTISYKDSNIFKQLWWNTKKLFGRLFNKDK